MIRHKYTTTGEHEVRTEAKRTHSTAIPPSCEILLLAPSLSFLLEPFRLPYRSRRCGAPRSSLSLQRPLWWSHILLFCLLCIRNLLPLLHHPLHVLELAPHFLVVGGADSVHSW